MIAAGETRARCTSSTAAICRTGCSSPPTSPGGSSRTRAAPAPRSATSARTGAIWCSTSPVHRIVEVLADLTTVVATRLKPPQVDRSVRRAGGHAQREPVADRRARIWPPCSCASTTARRAASPSARSAPGTRTICGSRSTGSAASLRWYQERQNELWIGRRDGPNGVLAQGSRRCSMPAARPYAHLPGGHQEAWSDAFRNVMRDIYAVIRRRRPALPAPRLRSPPSRTAIACA